VPTAAAAPRRAAPPAPAARTGLLVGIVAVLVLLGVAAVYLR
jgi:hypothetical protein